MPRRSSGGGRSFPRTPAPRTSKSTTPAPASSASSAPMKSEPISGGFVANMLATVTDGMIWSTGNAIAHRAMDAIMGPRVFQIEEVPSAAPAAQVDACARQYKAFNDCINTSGSNIGKCQVYMNMLSECRKSGSATPVAVSF